MKKEDMARFVLGTLPTAKRAEAAAVEHGDGQIDIVEEAVDTLRIKEVRIQQV